MDIRKILTISLGHLSCDVNGGALPTLLPYLAAVHHFDYQTAGGLMFAYSVASSIVQPAFGLLSDRVHSPVFVPLGVLLAGLGIGLCGLLDSYAAIFAALVLSGIGGALFHPEGARYANRVSDRRQGTGLSIFSVGGNSGLVLGPLLVTAATHLFGLRGTLVFALLSLVMAALLFRLLLCAPLPDAPRQAAKASPGGRNDWRAFGTLTLVIMSRSILFLGLNSYIPLYWTDVFQAGTTDAGLVLTFFCGVGVTSNVLGGMLADRIGYSRVIRLAYLVCLPALLLFPRTDTPWLAALLLAPLAVGLFSPFSAMVVLGQKYLARNVGLASGVTLGLALSVGGMVTPLLGRVADQYGGLPTAMLCLAPVAVVGGLAACFLRDPAPADDPGPQGDAA
ncbi:MFS transporter [uncultured Desulfovibrio sp.]|uniref:MFS transporter n=1 Tax=uncultured Desulfovibrio sp. TaxID=167968 RepID=UPI003208B9F7